MANDITTQSATPATVPSGTVITTVDTGSGHVQVTATQTQTTAMTSVAASATSVTLIAADAARFGVALYNDSASPCNVLLGGAGTADATHFTIRMSPGGYYETPFGYAGAIYGDWDTAVGSMRITEFKG